MKTKTTKTIGLIALVVASISLSGLAQTPVFLTGTATPLADRVADAVSKTTDATYGVQAKSFLLNEGWTVYHNQQGCLELIQSIAADPSLGGAVPAAAEQRQWLISAVHCLAYHAWDASPSWNISCVDSFLDTYASDRELQNVVRFTRDWFSITYQPSDPAAAISYYDNMKGNFWATPDWVAFAAVLPVRLECAKQTHAADMLGWAKVLYYTTPFADSQKGIGSFATALRVKDQNLVRSAAFIQFNKDGVGSNILDSIPTPAQFIGITVYDPVLQYELAGDHVNAIKTAYAQFIAAPDTDSLNAGVAKVAQALRNKDGNLIRPNAFVNAQKAGTNYDIAELAQ